MIREAALRGGLSSARDHEVPHTGWRGGTTRSRTFNMLASVGKLFLDEARAANVIIWGACAVGGSAFVAASVAMTAGCWRGRDCYTHGGDHAVRRNA